MGNLLSRPSKWLVAYDTCHELGHTWSPYCLYSSMELFIFVFFQGLKIYVPLFLISNLLRKRDVMEILKNTLAYSLQSSLFLGINAGGFMSFICIFRHLLGRFYYLSFCYIPAFCASMCAILVERKNRRGALTGYVGAIGLETLYRMLKYRGYVRSLPYGEVLMFCLASSVLLYHFKSGLGKNDVVTSLFNLLFVPKVPQKIVEVLSSSGRLELVALVMLDITLVGGWGLGLGFISQAVLNILRLGNRIIRNPARIKQALTKPYNIQFGKFLASFVVLFKLTNMLLLVLSAPKHIRLAVSGFIAGLSMLFIRSTTISLYATVKAIEVLIFKAIDRGWLRRYYYGDAVIYCIFTAVLFHATIFEAHNMRLSYWKFIDNVTLERLRGFNYERVNECFGTDATQVLDLIKAQEQMEKNKQQNQQKK